jgi:hypothetical protein
MANRVQLNKNSKIQAGQRIAARIAISLQTLGGCRNNQGVLQMFELARAPTIEIQTKREVLDGPSRSRSMPVSIRIARADPRDMLARPTTRITDPEP